MQSDYGHGHFSNWNGVICREMKFPVCPLRGGDQGFSSREEAEDVIMSLRLQSLGSRMKFRIVEVIYSITETPLEG